MKLYLNKASPYARLAAVVVNEKRLTDRVELAWTDPWASPTDLLAVNPVAKVPALVTDAGQPIIDSVCICTYLDDIGHPPLLFPIDATQRLPALMKYGLGRGLIDVAFGVTIERRYTDPNQRSVLAERWQTAVPRTIITLEQDPALMRTREPPDIGDLAIAVGLGYVEFRLPEVRWRPGAPNMSMWFDRMNDRPSMRSTAPE